jgi:hypothetical protein
MYESISAQIRLLRGISMGCGTLAVALLLGLGGFCGLAAKGRGDVRPAKEGVEAERGVFHSKLGPWGQLEYSWMYLEAPEDLLDQFPMPAPVTRWIFEGMSPAGVRALFVEVGLETELVRRLMSVEAVSMREEGLLVEPRSEDLLALTAAQRAAIYGRLAASELNPFHKDPVFIAANDLDEFLRNTGVRRALAEKMRKLCYLRGEALVFSDVSELIRDAGSDTEMRQVFKLCTRTRTLVARLKVSSSTQLSELAKYWSCDYRARDVLPILRSVAEPEGVVEIDIAHLLPPTPRKLLYSFPVLGGTTQGRVPDCHWTTLNFFNYAPRDAFLDLRLATSHVLEHYETVDGEWKFGDALLFIDEKSGSAVHSCVYVADDLVFTKNGSNLATPWVLMPLEDVRRVYAAGQVLSIKAHRRLLPQAPRLPESGEN